MLENVRPAIPVTIISGFLGAGKTTLLNHLLQEDHGLRIGVLVNDFGDINIDADLIETVDEDVVSLTNGCICCSIREDLLEVILTLLARSDCPEYLIIEASGVADPSAIAFTFSTPGIRETARLDAVITVVDCEQVLATYPEDVHQLLIDQLNSAHIVLLNKTDLVDEVTSKKVEAWVHEISPKATVLHTSYGQVPVDMLLDVYRADKEETANQTTKPSFTTWSFESERPIVSLRSFNHALKQLPDKIIRVKGFVYLQDMPEQQIVVHRVGKRTEVYPGKSWGGASPCTRLVAIGLAGTVLPVSFQELLGF